MNFKEQMTVKVAEIEEILKVYMPKEEGPQKLIMEAMNYSVTVGGKRLRPMLMQETYRQQAAEAIVQGILDWKNLQIEKPKPLPAQDRSDEPTGQ